MPGPLRNPDSRRGKQEQRNKTGMTWIDLPKSGPDDDPPDMPLCPSFLGQWSLYAIDLWQRMWHSPESTQWDREHHEPLERYLILREQAHILGTMGQTQLKFMQDIENQHGMNPASRRRLYWRIVDDESNEATVTSLTIIPGKKGSREDLR